jgi:hypothetical protein
MGKCCSVSKDSNKKPLSSPESEKTKPFLVFQSKSCKFTVQLEYFSNKSLSSYLNHLILSHPELASECFSVSVNSKTLNDYHQSVKSLDLKPNDLISLEIQRNSKDPKGQKPRKPEKTHKKPKNSSENSSSSLCQDEIAEEESTTKLQIQVIQSKLGKIKTESTGEAVSLWKTAISSPKRVKIKEDESEASSFNPLDLTLGDKIQKFQSSEIKGGQSVIIESDDSCVKGDKHALGHPNDFFKDLQGPFSVLKAF